MLQRVLKSRFRKFQDSFSTAKRRLRPNITVRSLTVDPPTVKRRPCVVVDPKSKGFVELEFVEEPLGVMAEQGHGYIRTEFGDEIGPDKRYKVVRKLGWGTNSSVWMAFDTKEERYVAIKALTGFATNLIERELTWELDALERVADIPPPPGIEPNHCPRLLTPFLHPGKGQDRPHLCLVTDIMGGDVKSLQVKVAGKQGLPLPLAKRILLHTLRGLAHMHHCDIVHTDLKPDNIMFDTGTNTQDNIAKLIKTDPARLHPPEKSFECIVQTAVSQPFPLPSLSEAMNRNYIVSDFGSTQPAAFHTAGKISPDDLRAPEIILEGSWDTKVDIWAFGCLIFELIIGRFLFVPRPWPEYMLDAPTGHLWQMLCFTQEQMTREQVDSSKLGDKYFVKPNDIGNPFCQLRSDAPILNNPFALSLRHFQVLQEADVLSTARVMRRCLRLNPKDRPTAEELLQDPWWHGAA